MITIDGSYGEGGGQVLRTSLALAMLTGQSFKITRIRSGRKKPGLLRQHLTAVKAAEQICQAETSGAALHSTGLTFKPGKIVPGKYEFKVGTAGSATLVLQTVLPALLIAEKPSTLFLEGGTHNPFAPPFDFLQRSFIRIINQLGPEVTLKLERYGFYPAGGGRFRVEIKPAKAFQKIELLEKGAVISQKARAFSAQISPKIGEAEIEQIRHRMQWASDECRALMVKSSGPGNIVMLEVVFENVTEIFTGFGEVRRPLKKVVAQAVTQARQYLSANVPVGKYLADQLLLPLAMAGSGIYKTLKPTLHTTTNIQVIEKFMNLSVKTERLNDEVWLIQVI